MGWWSATIMGGDSPCDQICAYENIVAKSIKSKLGREFLAHRFDSDDEPQQFTAEQVNAVSEKLLKQAKKDNGLYGDDGIAGQVLGVFLMQTGARISAETKKFIIESARMDEWAMDDAERKRYINKFIKQVQTYKAKKPKHVSHESLGQKLFEAIAKSSKKKSKKKSVTLINKNI